MRKRKKKGFEFSEGVYYFTIKGGRNNITVHRKEKSSAISVFKRYESVGKDIEWHGMWDGKQFVE